MTPVSCPDCRAEVQPGDLVCVKCGANLTRLGRTSEEQPSAPTIMHERVRLEDMRSAAAAGPAATCPHCGASLPEPAARACPACRRPLRHPAWVTSLVVLRLSFRHEDVSRRHATVTVDDAGRATVRDEHSTNGTFVNGDRVLPGSAVTLSDGDELRLAAKATAQVHLPRAGPARVAFTREETR